MYHLFLKLYDLLDSKAKLYFPISAICSLFVAMAEVLGIGMVLPFLLVITDPGAMGKYELLKKLVALFGTQTHSSFVMALGLAIVVMFIVKNLAVLALLRWQIFFIKNSEAELAIRLLGRYQRMPIVDLVRRNTSEMIRNASNEVTLAFSGFLLPILTLITELVVVLGVVAVVFNADPSMAMGIILFFVVAAGLYYGLVKNKLTHIGQEILRDNFLILRDLKENLLAVKEVTVLGQAKNMQAKFSVHRRNLAKYRSWNTFLSAVPRLYLEISMLIGITVVAALTLPGRPLGEMVGVLGLLAAAGLRVMPSVNRILVTIQTIKTAVPSVKVVLAEFEESEPNVPVPVATDPGDGVGGNGEVVLCDVRFTYPCRATPALDGVNLVIHPAQTVGLVGASGAGKSTLVDVLLGFLTPDQGSIKYGGFDIHQNLAAWRRKIGYVSQTIFLSDDTISANIALGMPADEVSAARLEEVVALAHLGDVVSELPNGLETRIGEEGIQLSVGQRQRIGIARALYHDPDVLLFDEATSALDNETEHRISEMISELGGNKTVVIIAHRLSTVRHCDKIFYFEGGRKIAEGDFETLKETCPGFANLALKGSY